MKDKLLRGQRNKGYKWLILMDRNNKKWIILLK
jgi:hypothetical protein